MSALRRWLLARPPAALLALFCAVNLLNYVDRGIVPGAFSELSAFIRGPGADAVSRGLDPASSNSSDTALGALQSAFIVGYSASSLLLGHAASAAAAAAAAEDGRGAASPALLIPGGGGGSRSGGLLTSPFRIMTLGLGVWVAAVALSAAAPTYGVLLLARGLSGVGEASFQTVVGPFLEDAAPVGRVGVYLSLFYTCIPVGTALGYAFGGAVRPWRLAFALEAAPMLLLLPLLWCLPHPKTYLAAHGGGGEEAAQDADGAPAAAESAEPAVAPIGAGEGSPVGRRRVSVTVGPAAAPSPTAPSDNDALAPPASPVGATAHGGASAGAKGRGGSFWRELCACLGDPVYMCTVCGYAGFTAVVAGLGAFGPTFVQGLRLLTCQSTASLAFGGVISAAGLLGTPLGGLWLDHELRQTKTASAASDRLGGASSPMRIHQPQQDLSVIGEDATTAATPLLDPVESAPASAASPTGSSSTTASRSQHQQRQHQQEAAGQHHQLQLAAALRQSTLLCAAGAVVCLLAAGLSSASGPGFFALLALGATLLFSNTGAVNLAVMLAAPSHDQRPFAIGLGTLLVHALGDVPAPPIIGALADGLSPVASCPGGGGDSGGGGGSDCAPCVRPAGGLRATLLLTLTWLAWPVGLWGLGWALARRRARRAGGRGTK